MPCVRANLSTIQLQEAMSEQAVKVASKLYEARDTMRRFWAERYPTKMEEYQGYIKRKATLEGCDDMKAVMALVKGLQARHEDSGMSQALLFAAYVELIEPSK